MPLAVADDDMHERLAACAACHGEQGQGIRGAEYFPHLAGKPSGYLLEQLQGFRDGRRANTQMTWLVQYLDDAYMKEIADYYSTTSAAHARGRCASESHAPIRPRSPRDS